MSYVVDLAVVRAARRARDAVMLAGLLKTSYEICDLVPPPPAWRRRPFSRARQRGAVRSTWRVAEGARAQESAAA